MSLLIPGTNSIKDTTYDVANSLRFDSGSSDSLQRSTTAGTRTTWTFSTWIKRSSLGSTEHIAEHDDSNYLRIRFTSGNVFEVFDSNGNNTWNWYNLFKETASWYHIVLRADSTDGTNGNRLRLYVNGSLASANTVASIAQDYTFSFNQGGTLYLGKRGGGDFFNGYLTETVLIDGTSLAPTSFGEFDSDSPTIWKPKDVSGLTFGSQGFYLDFENSSSLGADVSGNSNNFSVNNLTSIDQCTDTCTNNFCTFTSENHTAGNFTLSEGNLKTSRNTGTSGLHGSSIMPTDSGKWYFEVKIGEAGQTDRSRVGIMNYQTQLNNSSYSGVINTPSQVLSGCTVSCKAAKLFVGTPGSVTETTASGEFSDGDIVQFAMDLDNKAIYVGRNGTYLTLTGSSGGDPTSGSSKTGAITTSTTIMDGSPMTAYTGLSVGSGSDQSTMLFNFGNPPFSISSGNSDGNGFGNFEYAPPTGYLAWCSKNLAESG